MKITNKKLIPEPSPCCPDSINRMRYGMHRIIASHR